MQISERLSSIKPSLTLSVNSRALELKAQGVAVTSLAVGEPDFPTPAHVCEAAKAAIDENFCRYTAVPGIPPLREAIAGYFKRAYGVDVAPDCTIASNGGKQSLYNLFAALLNDGDEVLIPSPYWVSYPDMVYLNGGVPVAVKAPASQGFKVTVEQLEAALTPKAKILVFNSPSNPSGAAYSAEQLRPVLEVVERHPQVWLLADDIYEHILYDGRAFATPAAVLPSLRDRTLTVNGVSKSYAMTGWRLGYGAGPKALIAAMAVVQSQATSCPSSISQAAAVAALTGPQDVVRERCQAFQARRDLVVAALNASPGLHCRVPEGAFYTFASCGGVLGRTTPGGLLLRTDADFCAYLLREHHVAVVPGGVLGLAPYFRISYAASTADLQEACARIQRACQALF